MYIWMHNLLPVSPTYMYKQLAFLFFFAEKLSTHKGCVWPYTIILHTNPGQRCCLELGNVPCGCDWTGHSPGPSKHRSRVFRGWYRSGSSQSSRQFSFHNCWLDRHFRCIINYNSLSTYTYIPNKNKHTKCKNLLLSIFKMFFLI